MSLFLATCYASLVRRVSVCLTLSGDLLCESCKKGVCVSFFLATCYASLVRRLYVCVTLSGDLLCESCKKGVCVCHSFWRLAMRVL